MTILTRSLSGISFFFSSWDAAHLLRAVYIPQEPPKKNWWHSDHYFRKYKGIFKKYKGKFGVGQFLLPFVTGGSNRLHSLVRMLHFYCSFHRHQYRPLLMPYGHLAIWPYGHILTIWPFSHIAIWCQMWPIWVSMETALQMQHSSEGIKMIGPSCKKWEQKLSNGKFSFVFLKNPLYSRQLVATPQKWSECHQIFVGASWGISTAMSKWAAS